MNKNYFERVEIIGIERMIKMLIESNVLLIEELINRKKKILNISYLGIHRMGKHFKNCKNEKQEKKVLIQR